MKFDSRKRWDMQHLVLDRRRVDPNGCWIWTGTMKQNGYGQVPIGRGKFQTAHRISYAAFVGELPEGKGAKQIDHLCRNRACVNPQHLELVTVRENLMRSPLVPTALNAKKTHCKYGHEFTPENTDKVKGGRGCRACKKASKHEIYHRLYSAAANGGTCKDTLRRKGLWPK